MPSPCRRSILASLTLALAIMLPLAAAASQQPVVAHLFLVPAKLADGRDAAPQTAALEAWLAETCGGYTRLGPGRGGWKNETGHLETEANAAYLVTAPRDVAAAIARRLTRDFGVRVPYVLTFPAGVFVP